LIKTLSAGSFLSVSQSSQSSTSQPSRPPLPSPNQLISQFPTLPQNLTHPPPLSIPLSQATGTTPSQLTLSQQQQLDQQFQQFQQQTVQQQTVLNQQFVLNENQRQTLQNLIIRQQQEAQQLAQQTSLPYTQLQLPPQHYENLRQVSVAFLLSDTLQRRGELGMYLMFYLINLYHLLHSKCSNTIQR